MRIGDIRKTEERAASASGFLAGFPGNAGSILICRSFDYFGSVWVKRLQYHTKNASANRKRHFADGRTGDGS